MSYEFKKAERKQSKLRLAITGPSGSGKTYSALRIASGIVPIEDVAVIDTESGSAALYSDLGDYSTLDLDNFDPANYMDAMDAAVRQGFKLIIIDSLSPAWAGEGGLLDQQGKAAQSKYRGNSYAAWREVTPKYNRLVEHIIRCPVHVIATMRSKVEYVQGEMNGKKTVEKVGLAPIQREGIEYEFTTVFDLSQGHVATVTKDRTGLFDGKYFKPDEHTGECLNEWLTSGKKVSPVITVEQRKKLFAFANAKFGERAQDVLKTLCAELGYESTANLSREDYETIVGKMEDLSSENVGNLVG